MVTHDVSGGFITTGCILAKTHLDIFCKLIAPRTTFVAIRELSVSKNIYDNDDYNDYCDDVSDSDNSDSDSDSDNCDSNSDSDSDNDSDSDSE